METLRYLGHSLLVKSQIQASLGSPGPFAGLWNVSRLYFGFPLCFHFSGLHNPPLAPGHATGSLLVDIDSAASGADRGSWTGAETDGWDGSDCTGPAEADDTGG